MPRNEDGEFELILGNRQLLSVFFIVVILMGVFFTMGYIVGRNSSPITADTRKPVVVDAPVRNDPVPGGDQPSPAIATPMVTPDAPKVTTEPMPVEPPPVVTAEKKPEKVAPPKPEKPKSASPLPDQPAAGQTYLQVSAVAKAEAEISVDILAKKGFHAIYTPVPEKPQTYRVLVGPFKDAAAINQARNDLDKAGFAGRAAFTRKY